MLHLDQPPLARSTLFVLFIFSCTCLSRAHNSDFTITKGRSLMGIKETPDGGNVTFDCSPSGPCIPCSRSEKNDEKYRCSETVYRIRLKCIPSKADSKDSKVSEAHKTRSMLEHRNLGSNQPRMDRFISSKVQSRLLVESSKSKGGSGAYVTYRSCIPAVNDERMSVLGFEVRCWLHYGA
ncbi:F20P5.28 protein [Striga asiatica]|uniref:F20P5.28 protein n=1 Tax=Striga asiatica TaxID=4170 RepID=A0A5A7PHQ8_STRAF|nr:F20P5.28 protein [Striga asiatica]